MKRPNEEPLPRAVKIAMIESLARGAFSDENKTILNDYLNPEGAIEVEVIDNRLQVEGLTQAEFEQAVVNIRREQFGGETRK